MWYHYTNKGDSFDGQCMDSMVIEGALDSIVDEIMVDKNIEKVGICKYNLYGMVVGIEVAEQEEVEV
jgi:hypothetical protein